MLLAPTLAAFAAAQAPTIYTPGNGVSLPQPTRQVKAAYTEEAKANRIEGKVGLDVSGRFHIRHHAASLRPSVSHH